MLLAQPFVSTGNCHAAARYYVTMDMLRRVLEDYFGYSTTFVMNVTDVDDKIIRRARLNHLLQQYLARTPDTAKVPFPACMHAMRCSSTAAKVMLCSLEMQRSGTRDMRVPKSFEVHSERDCGRTWPSCRCFRMWRRPCQSQKQSRGNGWERWRLLLEKRSRQAPLVLLLHESRDACMPNRQPVSLLASLPCLGLAGVGFCG